MIDPSTSSTIEWTTDCGCKAPGCGRGRHPNSQCADNLEALVHNVAESMVIFRPIRQVGCFSASSAVTDSSSMRLRPETVRRTPSAQTLQLGALRHAGTGESRCARCPPEGSLLLAPRRLGHDPAGHDQISCWRARSFSRVNRREHASSASVPADAHSTMSRPDGSQPDQAVLPGRR